MHAMRALHQVTLLSASNDTVWQHEGHAHVHMQEEVLDSPGATHRSWHASPLSARSPARGLAREGCWVMKKGTQLATVPWGACKDSLQRRFVQAYAHLVVYWSNEPSGRQPNERPRGQIDLRQVLCLRFSFDTTAPPTAVDFIMQSHRFTLAFMSELERDEVLRAWLAFVPTLAVDPRITNRTLSAAASLAHSLHLLSDPHAEPTSTRPHSPHSAASSARGHTPTSDPRFVHIHSAAAALQSRFRGNRSRAQTVEVCRKQWMEYYAQPQVARLNPRVHPG